MGEIQCITGASLVLGSGATPMWHFHNAYMFNFTSGATSAAERAASKVVAPVVAESFLYAGAQNPSDSPVKEMAPPVRVWGGVYCS